MIPLLYYALKVIVCSGILYGYYLLALRNKIFHRWNRFYLLASVVLSLSLPILKIHFFPPPGEETANQLPAVLTVVNDTDEFVYTAISAPETPSFAWTDLLPLVCGACSVIILFSFLRSLFRIRQLYLQHPKEKISDIYLISTEAKGTPFSFLKYIFWNRAIDLQQTTGKQILQHELVHVRHRHSWDNIFMNLVLTLAWINPFFWLIRRELITIHEFIADELSVEQQDVSVFAAMLLQVTYPAQFSSFANPFFTSSIKRRIAMINKLRNNPKVSYISRVLVLPLAAFLFLAFTLKTKKNAVNEERITIIVDAGHGGKDKGVSSADGKYTEADLTLQLAKQVQSLAGEYNIDVVMTREDERFPGNADNINDALRKRTEMARTMNPAAFISLHIGSAGQTGQENKTVSGFEAYVSSGANAEQSKVLASTLLDQIAGIYATRNPVKQRSSKIEVLDNNPAPAVIMECGFISNEKDLAFITDKTNQEKLARKILEGVRQFHSYTTTGAMNDLPAVKPVNDTPPSLQEDPGQASYPGGLNAWRKYLEKNLDARIPVRDGWKPGTYNVLLQFKILADGSLADISAVNYKGTKTAAHCISLIQSSGKWIPAKKDGNPIMTVFKQPITFVVSADAAYKGELHKDPANTLPGEVVVVGFPDPQKPTTKVDKEASFPGGAEGWRNHLIKNLNASLPADEGWPQGQYTVMASFIVKKDGSLDQVTTENYAGTKVAEECIRLLKSGPKWTPAELNGMAVNSYRKQPITFVIEEEGNSGPRPKDPVVFSIKDRQNRLFIGLENPLNIATHLPESSVRVTISQGSISKKSPGQYTIRVTSPGTTTVRLFDNNNRELSQHTFTVAALPKPGTPGSPDFIKPVISQNKPATYLVSPDESQYILAKDLRNCDQLYISADDKSMKVVSYNFTTDLTDGTVVEYSVAGNKLKPEIKKMLNEAREGQMMTFQSIWAKGADGKEIKVQAKVFFVKS